MLGKLKLITTTLNEHITELINNHDRNEEEDELDVRHLNIFSFRPQEEIQVIINY